MDSKKRNQGWRALDHRFGESPFFFNLRSPKGQPLSDQKSTNFKLKSQDQLLNIQILFI
jgi:hypothetical protein